MNHPGEKDLALFAGGETGRVQRFLLGRHLRACPDCQDKVAEYRDLRSELGGIPLPDVNWNFLAAEMRANIRLGFEAGACVRSTQVASRWNPRLLAFASVLLLIVAGESLRDARPHAAPTEVAAPTLQLTQAGVEFRTGSNSLTLLNYHGAQHHGTATNQTVSAQGDIGTGYIDGDTESVTINNVYLQ